MPNDRVTEQAGAVSRESAGRKVAQVETSPEMVLRALRSAVFTIWTKYRRLVWPAATALLAIAFIVAVVRPFERPIPRVDEKDVAEAWSDSVNRLGLLPVFPPEEDFNVGDVWAVITSSNGKPMPILGEGLRVDHIDLRAYVDQPKDEPVFAETAEQQKDGYRHLNPVEVSAPKPGTEKISLTLAAFPGVTIRHSIRASGTVGGSLAVLAGGRDDVETEELRIPVAETYGVPAAAAFAELDKYCSSGSSKHIICTDEYARRALAFAVTDRVLNTVNVNGNYQYSLGLQLRLVYRVFLAREIEHKQYRAGSRGVEGRAAIDSARPLQGQGAAPGTAGETSLTQAISAAPTAAQALEARAAVPSNSETGAAFSRADSSTIEFNQVFQRPVAFGYRAITIALVPSKPSELLPP
jgi:hypothetical protein